MGKYSLFPSLYTNTSSPSIRKVAVKIVGPAPPEPAVWKENTTLSTSSVPPAAWITFWANRDEQPGLLVHEDM